ncbi:MAG TPA: nucleoside deaminase [Tepidisphaeraceae bacterium]|nr:nucleoside deaminase [Tepidisphaeraceae bacterium]
MSDSTETTLKHLRHAVRLSREGMTTGCGGPFGAVVVRGDKVIGEGFNRVLIDNDPTAHAEVVAIRSACKHLKDFSLTGCVVYASSQPCPMCLAAIYWSRADSVVFANTIDDAAAIGFDDRFFYEELTKSIDMRSIPQTRVLVPEARAVFDEWNSMQNKRPY